MEICRGREKTKESLGVDKYLLGYLRCCPEMVISLLLFTFFQEQKGTLLSSCWLKAVECLVHTETGGFFQDSCFSHCCGFVWDRVSLLASSWYSAVF